MTCALSEAVALVIIQQHLLQGHVDRFSLLKLAATVAYENGSSVVLQGYGIDIIVEGLRQNINDVTLVRVGCDALRILSTTEEGCFKVTAANAVGVLVSIMATHPANVPILTLAMQALGSLCVSDMACINLLNCDGLAVVLAVMRENLADQEILRHGCVVLENLSTLLDADDGLLTTGIAEMVLQAMLTHPYVVPIQQQACWVLRHLAHNVPRRSKLLELGAMEIVVGALKVMDDEMVYTGALPFLWLLCQDPCAQVHIGTIGGIETIVQIMKRQPSPPILQQCCGLLWKLALCPSNRSKLVSAGALQVTMGALAMHEDHDMLVAYGKALLWRLSAGWPFLKKVSMSFLSLVVEALRVDIERHMPVWHKDVSIPHLLVRLGSLLLLMAFLLGMTFQVITAYAQRTNLQLPLAGLLTSRTAL